MYIPYMVYYTVRGVYIYTIIVLPFMSVEKMSQFYLLRLKYIQRQKITFINILDRMSQSLHSCFLRGTFALDLIAGLLWSTLPYSSSLRLSEFLATKNHSNAVDIYFYNGTLLKASVLTGGGTSRHEISSDLISYLEWINVPLVDREFTEAMFHIQKADPIVADPPEFYSAQAENPLEDSLAKYAFDIKSPEGNTTSEKFINKFPRTSLTYSSVTAVPHTMLTYLMERPSSDTHILCFGDSLTKGTFVVGAWDKTYMHPYSIKLQHLLKIATSKLRNRYQRTSHNSTLAVSALTDTDLKVQVVAENGKPASYMPPLLKWSMAQFCPHLVIIGAGVNDLRDDTNVRVDPFEISQRITFLHEMAYNYTERCNHTVFTAVLNIPERMESSLYSAESESRRLVNHNLLKFVHSNHQRTFLVDIESQFDQSIPYNKGLWSRDWTHMSVKGYDSLAYLIFKNIAKYRISER